MCQSGEYTVVGLLVVCSSRKLDQLTEGKDAERCKIVETQVRVVVVCLDFGVMTLLLHMRSGNLQAYLVSWFPGGGTTFARGRMAGARSESSWVHNCCKCQHTVP